MGRSDTTHAKRMWALDGARMTVDDSMLVWGGKGSLTLPVPTFLIEHERGLVLFDTGLVPDAAYDAAAVYGEYASQTRMSFTPDQRVDKQLEAIGFTTADITHVLLSHSHLDHTGGLYLFPQAKFFIGEGELPFVGWPTVNMRRVIRPADLHLDLPIKWNELWGDYDLFGDGSIVMLHCPGHTPGNYGLFVRLRDRSFVLTGDTVHRRVAFEGTYPAPGDVNTEEARRSIRKLAHLAMSHDAAIWINHDPEDWNDFEHAPFFYS